VNQGRGVARWGVVLLYVAAIYLTIPYTPRWWTAAQAATGASFTSLALLPLATIGGLALAAVTYRTRADIRALLALTALGGTYYYLYRHVFQEPVEKLHLIEYGLLSWIIWWAWRPGRQRLYRPAAGVWLLSAAVGAADEWIQHFTPGRFGEFRDVVINWESAALGLAVLLVAATPWKSRSTAPDESHTAGA
jgi:VanZ family protein